MRAEEIVADHEGLLAEGHLNHDLLQQYFQLRATAAVAFIAAQARRIASLDSAAHGEAVTLTLALPYLLSKDQQWKRGHIKQLPEWLQEPKVVTIAEEFSLRIQRPVSAYQWAMYREQADSQGERSPDYDEYLRNASRVLAEMNEYRSAIYCLREAIAFAETAGNQDSAAEGRIQVAELYSKLGQPQPAAEAVRAVVRGSATESIRGRAVVLRLKYLYEAGEIDRVWPEFVEYRKATEFGPYLPQMMYVAWVALRRENQLREADALQAEFLEKFPSHPLAADVYFAKAMTALAESDYREASRLLEIVEYKFPESRLLPRVKEIRERLKALDGSGGTSDAAAGRR